MGRVLIPVAALVVALLVFRIGDHVVAVEQRRPAVGVFAPPAPPRAGGRVLASGEVAISLSPLDDELPARFATADADGAWFADVVPGRYRLGVFAAGYVPQFAEVALPTEARTIQLARGGSDVRGRVLDTAGHPLPGARVMLHDGDQLAGLATSAPDGSFAATLAGPHTRLTVVAPGHVELEVPAGTSVLRLAQGVSLQGVVTNAYDDPCPYAALELRAGERTLRARSDPFGRFELLVPLGELEVIARSATCFTAGPSRLQITGPRSIQLLALP